MSIAVPSKYINTLVRREFVIPTRQNQTETPDTPITTTARMSYYEVETDDFESQALC